ncbi:MAG: NAD(P)/FAD-dependent oxidoreductase [Bdellovibrionota bacterium]
MNYDFDCAVIGGGPGGLVSALYLKRYLRSVVVVNSGIPRAMVIPKTRNLMGFPNGISGSQILSRLTRHLNKLKVDRLAGEALVTRHRSGFKIKVGNQTPLIARKVILATGIEDIHPDLDNLKDLRRRGLLRYCPVCDAYDYRNEPVTILARDDHGLQKAFFLSRYTRRLHIVVPAALAIAPQRMHELRKLRVRLHRATLRSIEPSRIKRGVWLCFEDRTPVFSSVVYPMLGAVVRDSAFCELRQLRRSKEGFLIATTEQRLSIPGMFGVGDCVNLLAQLSVAAGQAAIAATTIQNDLCAKE